MHDDQFTATGPHRPASGSGFPEAAFSTSSEDMGFQWGLRVLARRCGVTGQTSGGGIAGVCGQGRFSQFGVLGTAFGGGAGVVGASVSNTNDLFNTNVPPADFRLDSMGGGSGTGVLGQSGSGLGVHGISSDNTGVFGMSRTGAGAHGGSDRGTGLLGTSESGFGVHAISGSGPGAVLESKQAAQVRLVPRDITSPEGRVAGSGGELLATAGTDAIRRDVFRLWFCTRPGEAASAGWELVAGPRPFPAVALSEGATGVDVKRVQMRLNMVFGTDLDGDGELGPITREAVVAFQQREQLLDDGVVNAETWERLHALD